MSIILDGTNDYYSSTTISIPSGKTGTFHTWFKPDVVSTQALLMGRNTGGNDAFWSSAFNTIASIVGRNSSGTVVLGLSSTGITLAVGNWYNLLASWDLENGLGNLLINGTDVLGSTTLTDDDINYGGVSAWQVGAQTDAAGDPANQLNGTLDDIYFSTSYIELATAANVRLFYGREGTTVGLGWKGNRPTGSRPEIFQSHGPNNYGTNEGTEADFTRFGSPTFSRGRPAAHETLSRGFYGERWRESERSGIPFRESRLVIEPASGLEVARREFSTDRDEINRRKRFGTTIFEY